MRKFLWISVLVHLIVFASILFSSSLFKLLRVREQKVTWIRLTKGTNSTTGKSPFKKTHDMPYSTLREQKMALTEISKDKKGSDKKSIDSPQKKKVETTVKRAEPDGGIQFKPKKSEQDKTIEQALARVEEELKKRQIELEAAQIEDDGGGQSPVGSLDTQNGELNPALIAYYEALKRKINQEWITTPKALEEGANLTARIHVMIDQEGRILSSDFELKSSDISFDLSAKRAIERAAPFPPPPEEIKGEALREGFLIEFNPRSVVGNY